MTPNQVPSANTYQAPPTPEAASPAQAEMTRPFAPAPETNHEVAQQVTPEQLPPEAPSMQTAEAKPELTSPVLPPVTKEMKDPERIELTEADLPPVVPPQDPEGPGQIVHPDHLSSTEAHPNADGTDHENTASDPFEGNVGAPQGDEEVEDKDNAGHTTQAEADGLPPFEATRGDIAAEGVGVGALVASTSTETKSPEEDHERKTTIDKPEDALEQARLLRKARAERLFRGALTKQEQIEAEFDQRLADAYEMVAADWPNIEDRSAA